MSYRGKKNIYVCDTCFGHIVTVDRDEGVTPFMTTCKAKAGCRGNMKSSMYRVFDQDIGADHEWYRPDAREVGSLSVGVLQHVEKGGLLLRKITDDTSEALEPQS